MKLRTILSSLGIGCVIVLAASSVCAQPDAPPWDEPYFSAEESPLFQPLDRGPESLKTKQDISAPAGPPSQMLDLLDLKNMDVLDVLKLISQKSGLNIVAAQNVQGRITIYLKNIHVLEALRIIVEAYGWAYVHEEGIVKIITALDYETKYGHKFGEKIETRIKQLLYAQPSDLSPVLDQMKSYAGKVIANEKSKTLVLMDSASTLAKMEEIIKRVDVPTKTEVFDLSYSSVEDLEAKIEPVLTPAVGTVKTDVRSRKLIVSDTEQKLDEIREIVGAFDEKDEEVLIEAKILQVTLTDEYKLGIDWEAVVSNYHQLKFKSDFDLLATSDKRGNVSIGTLSRDDYTALLEALNTVGVTDILSNPKITTVNEKEAKILVGSTQPYVTSTTTTPASGPTVTSESVNFIEVGVKLFVTPTIHKDGFITMKIKPEVSSVTGNITTSNNNTIPVVETSEAETTVMVKDGVTIVIGGLIKEESIKSKKKVPLLGDIPLLGAAFRSQSDKTTKTELVIFLTPSIISGDVNKDVTFSKNKWQ